MAQGPARCRGGQQADVVTNAIFWPSVSLSAWSIASGRRSTSGSSGLAHPGRGWVVDDCLRRAWSDAVPCGPVQCGPVHSSPQRSHAVPCGRQGTCRETGGRGRGASDGGRQDLGQARPTRQAAVPTWASPTLMAASVREAFMGNDAAAKSGEAGRRWQTLVDAGRRVSHAAVWPCDCVTV
jgi:hypothetical protein